MASRGVTYAGVVTGTVCLAMGFWLGTASQKKSAAVLLDPGQPDPNARAAHGHTGHASAAPGCFGAQPSPDCEGAFGYLSPHKRQTGFAPFDEPQRDPKACAKTWVTDAQNIASVPHNYRLKRSTKQQFRSTKNEDLQIFYHFFSEMPYGSQHTYVELGAFDGITESNSRLFEYCAGWSGALIDGSPANFKELALPDIRPTAHKLHYIPSCHGFSTHDMLSFGNTGASSLEQSAAPESHKLIRTVHCAPLTTYLKHVGIRHIDFFSLDVEGAELLVLETVDFASGPVSFHVVMVESRNRQCGVDCPKRDAVRALMKKAGFLLYIGVPSSDTFVNATMAQPFRKLPADAVEIPRILPLTLVS